MKYIRRNEKAVSPVIATILMVAITVVLAAVLYVMVSGLIGTGSSGAPTIDIMQKGVGIGEYELKVTPDRGVGYSSYEVSVLMDGTAWSGFPKALSAGLIGSGPANENLTYTDVAGVDTLTKGDFFTLEGLSSGSTYELLLIWAADDGVITSEIINVP
ncbi:MAG: type IV pilin [Candidatus Thermoplasmatota archaeon]|nr:type IV pilin [Candidatus Thermoplasmatota archaeon]